MAPSDNPQQSLQERFVNSWEQGKPLSLSDLLAGIGTLPGTAELDQLIETDMRFRGRLAWYRSGTGVGGFRLQTSLLADAARANNNAVTAGEPRSIECTVAGEESHESSCHRLPL